jgi:hypothetical protein
VLYVRKSFASFVQGSVVLAGLAWGGIRPVAAEPVVLRVTFQPDCFRPSLDAACNPRKSGNQLDLGPQFAIWIESADGSKFVDTVMVTNLTAVLGLGNRPGHVTLPSGPKFPYGKRAMVLPVWAHRRGQLYDSVVMQDGLEREYWLGFHEVASSPDPYYCRPMTFEEIDVDAVTCPTRRFNSVKGRFFDPKIDMAAPNLNKDGTPKPYVPSAKTYYPPRNDLTTFIVNDCDVSSGSASTCPISAKKFAAINELDTIAGATPAYGRPFSKLWLVPDDLPEGDYAVFVEISKEFDTNASHSYPASVDMMLEAWGQKNNFGQPSVVYRVPFHLSRATPAAAATATLAGYGDPKGVTGDLHPPDSTISDAPGSGAGRLLSINVPPAPGAAPLAGRVLVATQIGGMITPPPDPEPDAGPPEPTDGGVVMPPPPPDAGTAPCPLTSATPLVVVVDDVSSESATISFDEPADPVWQGILQYEVRRWNGTEHNDSAFSGGLPVATIDKRGPGQHLSVMVPNLKSEIQYSIGARPMGFCGAGPVAYAALTTRLKEFTMLSGCFIATAAYGSPLAQDVALLRRIRDRAAAGHSVAAAAADVYARSSPPVANVIGRSEPARAVARQLLGPLVELVRALDRAR